MRLIGLEREPLGRVVGGLLEITDGEIGVGTVVVGRGIFRVQRDGAGEIAHRSMIALELGMRPAAPVIGDRVLRHQLDGLAEVLEGRVVLGKLHARIAPVVAGCAVSRRERDGAVEVLHRLIGMAQIHQRVAAVVVDRGIVRGELDRLVEILDRFFGLLHPPFGDAAIAVDAGLDVVGDLGRGERLVIGGDSLIVLPAHQRRRALPRTQKCLVFLRAGRPRSQRSEEKNEA
jgi:hypothetical protein